MIDLLHARSIISKTAKFSGIPKVEVELEDGYLNININGYDFSLYDDGAISVWETIPATWTEPEDAEEREVILSSETEWEAVISLFSIYAKFVVEAVAEGESEEQMAKELDEW